MGAEPARSSAVHVLDLDGTLRRRCGGRGPAAWSQGKVGGDCWSAAAGHTVLGGVLLGKLGRSEEHTSPVALLLPDPSADPAPPVARKVPKWFKR